MSSQGGSSNSHAHSSNSQANTPLSPGDEVSPGDSPATPVSDATVKSVEQLSSKEQEVSDGLNQNMDSSSEKPESSKNISAVQEAQQAPSEKEASTPHEDDGVSCRRVCELPVKEFSSNLLIINFPFLLTIY